MDKLLQFRRRQIKVHVPTGLECHLFPRRLTVDVAQERFCARVSDESFPHERHARRARLVDSRRSEGELAVVVFGGLVVRVTEIYADISWNAGTHTRTRTKQTTVRSRPPTLFLRRFQIRKTTRTRLTLLKVLDDERVVGQDLDPVQLLVVVHVHLHLDRLPLDLVPADLGPSELEPGLRAERESLDVVAVYGEREIAQFKRRITSVIVLINYNFKNKYYIFLNTVKRQLSFHKYR